MGNGNQMRILVTESLPSEKGRKREKRREKDEDINKVAAIVVIHSYGGHRDAASGVGFS